MDSDCREIAYLRKKVTLFFIFSCLLAILMLVLLTAGGCAREQTRTLNIFAGVVIKPVMDEINRAFEEKTGIKVYITYGGSGTTLSQMKLARSGDLYIPASPDYMIKAERDGVVERQSVKIVSYLLPVIAVQRDNPKNIQSLSDLAKPNVKVAIANPESVAIGLYAAEILDYNNLTMEIGKNIITYSENAEKLATFIALKTVDAVIGWHVFHDWDPKNIGVVYLKPEQLPRIAYIPVAVTTFSKDRESAQKFMDFLLSPAAQDVFRKGGYIATEAEAKKFAPGAAVGGEYKLPEIYRSLVK